MTDEAPTVVKQPYIIMFKSESDDGGVITHIHRGDLDYRGYSLLICDLVRHVARAFEVDEDDVWEWVMKERHKPTTKLTSPS
jgi:hypothetical protein